MIYAHGKKVGGLLLLCAALLLVGLTIGCPIQRLTGIPCPACGMSRAWKYALLFHFREAFQYHPLFLLAPWIVILIFREGWMPQHCRKGWIYHVQIIVAAVLLMTVYVYRIWLFPSGPVAISLQGGLLCRGIRLLYNFL
ncbi:MAG: DUF2752 domain-containing protein [Clostridia bacterium]|nr:DUF2752 domain-containing protein [Clostridia bacterium]